MSEERNYGVEPEPGVADTGGSGTGGPGPGSAASTMFEGREHLIGFGPPLRLHQPAHGFLRACGRPGNLVRLHKDRSERVAFHALQSALYQTAWAVILAIGWTITGLLMVIIVGFLLVPVMIVLSSVPFFHMAYAAYTVNQGFDYRYPLVADLIRGSRKIG